MSDISTLPADDIAAAPEPADEASAAGVSAAPAEPAVAAAQEASAEAAEPLDPAEPAAPAVAAIPVVPAVPDLSPAQCSARLAALFPALFGLQQPLPLKLRIQADIQQRAPGIFNRKSLSAFLHRYTTGTPYLVALSRIAQRADLDGQPAGEVAAEHREAAAAEVTRRRALMDARRAAEQAARREADASERAEFAKERAKERAAQREAEAAARQQQDSDQQGRRERATLLRAFDSSPLTRANFCALKGIAEADLEAQLTQARKEAAERPPAFEERAAPRHGQQRPRGPSGPGQRPRRPHPGA
jgi:sRNA-binding protein